MVDAKDIKDEVTLRSWLHQTGNSELAADIALRTALRVQPIVWYTLKENFSTFPLKALREVRYAIVGHTFLASGIKKKEPEYVQLVQSGMGSLYGGKFYPASAPFFSLVRALLVGSNISLKKFDFVQWNHFKGFHPNNFRIPSRVELLEEGILAAQKALSARPEGDTLGFAAGKQGVSIFPFSSEGFFDEIRADCRNLVLNGRECTPLWNSQSPTSAIWEDVRNSWRNSGPPFNFIADWYDALLEGQGPDWPLLEQIALIPSADWDAGPDRIAERIAEFQRTASTIDRAIAATPNAEKVVTDADTGRLTTIAIDDLGDGFRAEVTEELETAIRRFEEACDDAQTSNFGPVLLSVTARDLKNLREDLINPRLGDRAFHDRIARCRSILTRRVTSEGAENDPDVAELLSTMETACLTIIASSDEVREVVHRRNEELFYQLQLEHRVLLEELTFGMIKDCLPDLAASMRTHWQRATDPDATDEERRQSQYTITSRLPRGARAINYSRFQNGVRVVHPEPKSGDKPRWVDIMLSGTGAALLTKLLGL